MWGPRLHAERGGNSMTTWRWDLRRRDTYTQVSSVFMGESNGNKALVIGQASTRFLSCESRWRFYYEPAKLSSLWCPWSRRQHWLEAIWWVKPLLRLRLRFRSGFLFNFLIIDISQVSGLSSVPWSGKENINVEMEATPTNGNRFRGETCPRSYS